MENKESIPEFVESADSARPKKKGWDSNGCPLFIFGDDDAAEYDLDAIKNFFSKFKKKKKE